jgi:cobalt/nickel transport system permease protein
MHIPDGYIGPQTYAPAFAAMIPLWGIASRKIKNTLRSRQTPMLALGAAFSFVIMMFNVPIPGGTTGHATGAVLIAVLLGPWSAMIAVSLALIVQALIFGDGGITAIGANCFNMAVVMPFVGWWIYRLISGSSPLTSIRRQLAAAIAGYIGLNAAALTAAIMFGIQPMIAKDSAGHALYNPFGLKVAVPAMAIEHLLVFGFVEAVITAIVVAYLQRTDPSLLAAGSGMRSTDTDAPKSHTSVFKKVGIALLVLALISPLGLYLPEKLKAGSAWGEWGSDEIGSIAGYVPQGLDKLGSLWKAPMPDYAFAGQESAHLKALSVSYVFSGLVGIAVVALIIMAIGRLTVKKGSNEDSA